MATFRDLVDLMVQYADKRASIAELSAKNQNAPKYLYEEAQGLYSQAIEIADGLDEKLDAE